MINYKYRLVNTTCRNEVDLTYYNTSITTAIETVLPNARNIMVLDGHYSFEIREKASRRQLIKLGQTITNAHTDFISYMKIVHYKINKVSRQLFRRF